jgi:hypothetical protein
VAHEVPDDEEVAREAERVDHVKLAVEPLEHLRVKLGRGRVAGRGAGSPALGHGRIPLAEAVEAQPAQLRGGRPARGHLESGKMPLAEVELDGDGIGDLLAAGCGFRDERPVEARERLMHLLRALEVELARIHPHPVGIVAKTARVHAQQDVLRDRVLPVDVVAVAGGHGRDAELPRDLEGDVGHLLLDGEAVVLDLDEVAVAEEFLEPAGHLAGLHERLLLRPRRADQGAAELSRQAARQADDSLVVGREQFAVDPRFEIKAFEVGPRGELQEVGEAHAIAGQEREVVARVLLVAGILLKPAARGDVGLVADDRVDARLLRGVVKFEGAVEVAVVGDRQGVHPEFDRAAHEPVDGARAVEQAVVAVAVEMGETGRAHP